MRVFPRQGMETRQEASSGQAMGDADTFSARWVLLVRAALWAVRVSNPILTAGRWAWGRNLSNPPKQAIDGTVLEVAAGLT